MTRELYQPITYAISWLILVFLFDILVVQVYVLDQKIRLCFLTFTIDILPFILLVHTGIISFAIPTIQLPIPINQHVPRLEPELA